MPISFDELVSPLAGPAHGASESRLQELVEPYVGRRIHWRLRYMDGVESPEHRMERFYSGRLPPWVGLDEINVSDAPVVVMVDQGMGDGYDVPIQSEDLNPLIDVRATVWRAEGMRIYLRDYVFEAVDQDWWEGALSGVGTVGPGGEDPVILRGVAQGVTSIGDIPQCPGFVPSPPSHLVRVPAPMSRLQMVAVARTELTIQVGRAWAPENRYCVVGSPDAPPRVDSSPVDAGAYMVWIGRMQDDAPVPYVLAISAEDIEVSTLLAELPADSAGTVAGDDASTRRRGSVQVEELRPMGGTIDLFQARRAADRVAGEVIECYERELAHDASVEGRVDLRLTISPTGAVQRAETVDTQGRLRNEHIEACLTEAWRQRTLPSPMGGGIARIGVSYTFEPSETDP